MKVHTSYAVKFTRDGYECAAWVEQYETGLWFVYGYAPQEILDSDYATSADALTALAQWADQQIEIDL